MVSTVTRRKGGKTQQPRGRVKVQSEDGEAMCTFISVGNDGMEERTRGLHSGVHIRLNGYDPGREGDDGG